MMFRTFFSLGLVALITTSAFAQAEAPKADPEVKNPNGAGVVRTMKHPSYQELMAPKDSKDDNWHKLKLTDSEGKSFSLDKYRGKLLLINFFFTHCPDVCPPQTAALNTVFNKLGKFEQDSVQFVSITIDPDNDTKEELAKYKKQFTKTSNWTFARSDKATLDALGKHFGALSGDPKKPLDHRARLFLIKDDGNYLLSYEAAPVDIERMTRDLTDATRTFIKPKKKS
ncbi:MAG: SCO family protein [Proteobacteria bacterium]|nr:MAG: SCO family protein [Pseudomonadota bacterium]